MVRVKICCISSIDELNRAVEVGADAVGLVSDMPSGPGIVDDSVICDLSARTPPGVSRFLLTSRLDAAGIIDHVQRTGVDVVQVCDHVDPAVLQKVRQGCAARVVAVVHVMASDAAAYATSAAEVAHAILLDSGAPGADFRSLGGTGRTHDWDLSGRIVAASHVPVWLAGGLRPDNVAEAIGRVRPFGVDLCTGVRTDGHLDSVKLKAFMDAVDSASRSV